MTEKCFFSNNQILVLLAKDLKNYNLETHFQYEL